MLASLPRGTEMLPPGPEMLPLPAPAGIENQDPIETDRPSSPSRSDLSIWGGRATRRGERPDCYVIERNPSRPRFLTSAAAKSSTES
jgi:hypothetical protein